MSLSPDDVDRDDETREYPNAKRILWLRRCLEGTEGLSRRLRENGESDVAEAVTLLRDKVSTRLERLGEVVNRNEE